MKNSRYPEIKLLKKLRTLSEFNDIQLEVLANEVYIEIAEMGEKILAQGCIDKFHLYLLQGELKLTAFDGKSLTVSCGTSDLNHADGLAPIAQIRPSMYDVVVQKQSSVLRIPNELLTEAAKSSEYVDEDNTEIRMHRIEEENKLAVQLYQDLSSGSVDLPSLPDVAVRIEKAFNRDDVDADQIATIIQSDPVITAKLIMISNSPLYRGQAQISSLRDAIVRLGLSTCRKQVMIYTVNELFKEKTSLVKDQMNELWLHSQKVASISRVIAKKTGLFDPELAQLAGLLHDLGVIAIIQYAQEHTDLSENEEILQQTIYQLRTYVTGKLLNKWHFSQDIVTAGEECDDWFRNHENKADLCDLIIVAQYHSYLGSQQIQNMPPITSVPALRKLNMGELGPDGSLKILQESKDEIKAIQQLLASI